MGIVNRLADPKTAIKRLVLGFCGFCLFGGGIFVANAWQNEMLALLCVVGMALCALFALAGYIGVWVIRFKQFMRDKPPQ